MWLCCLGQDPFDQPSSTSPLVYGSQEDILYDTRLDSAKDLDLDMLYSV